MIEPSLALPLTFSAPSQNLLHVGLPKIASPKLSNMSIYIPSNFLNQIDRKIVGSIGMADIRFKVSYFSLRIDSAIRSDSDTESQSGACPTHTFESRVDSDIRSSTASEADLGASPLHGHASTLDKRIVSARLPPIVSNARRDVVDGLQLFSLAELVAATNHFSLDNKIGSGSFGVVYKAKLFDGFEVVIKRGITGLKSKGERRSDIIFLSRLNHRHVVGLIGFCEKQDERLLVYEYMKNGSLYDHLHGKENVNKGSSVLNSWKKRINIALDASLGIQYLDKYAPLFFHRDMESSNIFLDSTWRARVNGFGFSLYGLGVVLLELLTGKRHTTLLYGEDENETLFNCMSVVEFAVPAILNGCLVDILDSRVGPPDMDEEQALKLVAFTAISCVKRKGKDRPTMANVVANLEQALAILSR